MENSLMLLDESMKTQYFSGVVNTKEEKIKLFNSLEKCDLVLKDIVGQEIEIKDIYVSVNPQGRKDDETGEVIPKFRTIIFDKDGKSYATGSYGIYNMLRKMCQAFGEPKTWTEPIKAKVVLVDIGNNKTKLSLELIV